MSSKSIWEMTQETRLNASLQIATNLAKELEETPKTLLENLFDAGFRLVEYSDSYCWKINNGYAEVFCLEGDVQVYQSETRAYAY